MATFEERVLQELAALKGIGEQVTRIDGISARLDGLDAKFSEQVQRLDQVQAKVDLSVTSIGEIHQEKVHVARVIKESHSTQDADLDRLAQAGCFAASPTAAQAGSSAQAQPPLRRPFDPGRVPQSPRPPDKQSSKRPWMPKMEFPRFDGEGVRMWLDNCEVYFQLHQIPDGFKVMSASLHLQGNAAHWYQACKHTDACADWPRFRTAILQEFDVNIHRNCMRELLLLKHEDTVQQYRTVFNQLVYQVRLYDAAISETMLVTQFLLGLKEEIRSAVEIQLPQTVLLAAECALVQEAVLERHKIQSTKVQKQLGSTKFTAPRQEHSSRPQFAAGDLWRAKQLKEFRRANGLCYSCGKKYTQGHVYAKKPPLQLKALEVQEIEGQLSDDILNAISAEEAVDEVAAYLSVNAIAGSENPKTIRLRALVENKVMLLLVDSGSSHTFIDRQLTDKLKQKATALNKPLQVKVANGEQLQCDTELSGLQWWISGHTFTSDMKVIDLGGYDAILGMDWLAQWGAMTCHLEEKWLQFGKQGQQVKLQGIIEK